ncbi:universal stress protein [Pedosphaera parvula]|uniref:UspA domain protein n=1 Tax=Pedosphaera parvula (strain Ellin514) TaxID=320771 RepID=B9XD72_PEDPL|nr:universal stress protein [Pedosphaera parvula]EEF62018.1 UspA domain protein [Pedosphaera parvula Ellin514]
MLICNDGSEAANRALRLGANIASACQAEVTLLGILETGGKDDGILDVLRRGQQLLEDKKIQATLVIKSGEPIQEITRCTEAAQYDLVVIGALRKETHGLFWVSSKTYRIIKSVTPPVLAVMQKANTIKRILVCTGGKKYIQTAFELTGRIARGMDATVTLFHVMPELPAIYARLRRMEVSVNRVLNSKSELGQNLREEKETLEALGVKTEVRLRQGIVLDEIFQEIRSGNYDLIVTGSALNRGTLHTYVLGNVTREIVNRSTCAVLVVRTGIKSAGITQSLVSWFDRVTHRAAIKSPNKP